MINELTQYDTSGFQTGSYSSVIEKPWGSELHWTPADLPYVGKVIRIRANARLSLQFHDQKQESWLLISGRAKVAWENERAELVETELEPGQGYTCCVGQKHRLIGITDCEVIEVSTPEHGTTWRLEDDYARPHETEKQRLEDRLASRPST